MSTERDTRDDLRLQDTCPTCGGTREVTWVDVVSGTRRRIHSSTNCIRCGAQTAADFAELPPDIRAAFVARYGLWELSVDPDRTVRAFSALREQLGLPLTELSRFKNAGGRLATGTRVELTLLAAILKQSGIEGHLSRRETPEKLI
jgi:hypothetical protein